MMIDDVELKDFEDWDNDNNNKECKDEVTVFAYVDDCEDENT